MARKLNGRDRPALALLTAIVPVYSSKVRFAAGFKASVTVLDAPGASEGRVADEARVMYGVLGRLTVRSPLAAPPLLVTVKDTSVWVPTSIPVVRFPGLALSSGVSGTTETLSRIVSVVP